MNKSIHFARSIFSVLSIFFFTAFMISTSRPTSSAALYGILFGLVGALAIMLVEVLFKKLTLKLLNLTTLGLLFGYLFSISLLLLFQTVAAAFYLTIPFTIFAFAKLFIFLLGTYLGVILVYRNADELSLSIPFVKLQRKSSKSNEVIADISALADGRIIDLATSGLLDERLVIMRPLVQELNRNEESNDEVLHHRARRALEAIKKLEAMPHLHLRYHEADFAEIKDSLEKTIHLTKLLDASLLTAEINKVQMSNVEGVRIINLNALANSLKPLMQHGEFLNIKVQRYGKEERQGVGYLEDGTMVVINGGGDFIGSSIEARVLSVKHTSSGRMIFCNVVE